MARAYRKKPVVVEAVQWTGENHAEMCEFIDPEVFEIIPLSRKKTDVILSTILMEISTIMLQKILNG